MFQSVGRMFRSHKPSDDDVSSPKKSKKVDGGPSNHGDSLYQMNIDDSNIILERIKQLHAEQLMTDVILLIDGKEHPAHRLILCASSDVFQVMLTKREWSEWHESTIVLQEPQQCAAVFHNFLAYFYSGQITLTHENVMPILTLADKYNVKNLTKMCVSYMCSNISHAAAHSQLISWLQYTLACGHYEVSKQCQNFVKWNFELIAKTDDFGNFQEDIFVSVLQQNDLVVENELTLYQHAVKWLNLQTGHLEEDSISEAEAAIQIQTLTELVMMQIRFPMMSPRQLAELLLSPLVKKYKEFFVERMAIGMIYHSGQEERVLDLCCNENGKLLFTPRLYTSDNFSSVLAVENFSAIASYGTCTFMFSSHINLAEYLGDYICDWVVDLYPKGVWFKKFYLIVWQGTVEVPEYVLPTVRLSVTCKDIVTNRVKIGLLIYGETAGIEHIMHVVERIHTFDSEERLLNIDDIIPFEEINPRAECSSRKTTDYVVGSNKNTLKIHIIITPLNEFCSTVCPSFVLK